MAILAGAERRKVGERDVELFTWEHVDRAEELKVAAERASVQRGRQMSDTMTKAALRWGEATNDIKDIRLAMRTAADRMGRAFDAGVAAAARAFNGERPLTGSESPLSARDDGDGEPCGHASGRWG